MAHRYDPEFPCWRCEPFEEHVFENGECLRCYAKEGAEPQIAPTAEPDAAALLRETDALISALYAALTGSRRVADHELNATRAAYDEQRQKWLAKP